MSTVDLAQAGDAGGIGGWWVLAIVLVVGTLALFVGLALAFRRRLVVLRAARAAWKGSRGPEGGPVRRLRALPALLRDAWRGTYPELTRSRTLVWLVALVYLVSPVDLIPEVLPLLGITDDLGVGAWLLSTLYVESGHYVAARGSSEHEALDRES